MNDYDAYLFDWDGTLVPTAELWITELYNRAIYYNLPVTWEISARNFGDMQWVHRYGLPQELAQQYNDEVQEIVLSKIGQVLPYDGAIEMLQRLKRSGKKIGLITTANRVGLHALLDSLTHLEGIFDVIVTRDEVSKHKPDPEGILLALEHLQVPPARAIMIGDSGKDLEAASNAGIDSVLYYPSSHEAMYKLEHLQSFGPKYTVTAWQEL